ncbi:ChrR family anti-sigma-E factor [Zavarzinia compransoris]|uniref:ChrR family anti-sigma-E factor n=1 Tax=Zavarzinia marina TaxID=2911065 RepID=UPI001F2FA211|nr:ChrR family anti-sigma-E factor [Zavarzinia marina]MCF4165398.1 ChrR family anti-sigma-E factor [Zavarzinia marina]
MTPAHHVPFDLLVERAAGALPPAMTMMVDAHLALCAECRAEHALCEAVGGELLDGLEPVPMADDGLDRLFARILQDDEGNEAADAPEPAALPWVDDPVGMRLPPVLRPVWARSREKARWRTLVPGVRCLDLDLPVGPEGSAMLLHIDGGRGIPRHTHRGREFTLVLSGAFNDERGRFAAGDLSITDDSVRHKPVAEPGEMCLVFAVLDAPVRLTGALGIVQRLMGG